MAADSTPIVPVVVFEPNKLLATAGIKERMNSILALDGKVLSTQKMIVRVVPHGNGSVEQAELAGDLRVAPLQSEIGHR